MPHSVGGKGKTMACESCKKLLELLNEQVANRRRSTKPGYSIPVETLTEEVLACYLDLAVNGPVPAPAPKRTRTVERVMHSPLMQEMLNLQRQHKEKIAGLSEEDAAKVQKSLRLIDLEWQYDLSKRGQGQYANQFSSSVVTDEVAN
jgi:hypothetical protein